MITPLNEAAPFDEAEMFFSFTDTKGRIQSCNDVFLDISGYESKDILGAPHRIIRHPDMPRSVFRLFWNFLEAGRPVGAYVKNMAKSGRHYWVYALAFPCDGGFVSIRLKPTSERFQRVIALYQEIQAAEEPFGARLEDAIAAGTEVLDAGVAALGAPDYARFMADSLRDEVASRAENLATRAAAWKKPTYYKGFEELGFIDDLSREAMAGAIAFEDVSLTTQRIALNSAISAAKLSEAGAPLGVLSDQIARLAIDIAEQAKALEGARTDLLPSCEAMYFSVSFATLANEMLNSLRAAVGQMPTRNKEAETLRFGASLDDLDMKLKDVLGNAFKLTRSGVDDLRRSLNGFGEIAHGLRRVLMTTRIGHVTGRAMAANIEGAGEYATLLDEYAQAGESGRELVDALQDAAIHLDRAMLGWQSR